MAADETTPPELERLYKAAGAYQDGENPAELMEAVRAYMELVRVQRPPTAAQFRRLVDAFGWSLRGRQDKAIETLQPLEAELGL